MRAAFLGRDDQHKHSNCNMTLWQSSAIFSDTICELSISKEIL